MALADVLRNFDKVTNDMATAAEKVVYEVAGDLEKEAVKRTPIDSGRLRQSAKIRMIKRGNNPTAQVKFGGGEVRYAAAVHEINKNYNEPGTSWKYLETPLKEKSKTYLNYMRKKIGDKL